MSYSPCQIDKMLSRMVCLIDSREQQTESYFKRVESIGMPSKRATLSYGDYSAYTLGDNDETLDMRTIACIERKQGLTELCTNFTSGRARFQREFERAKADGCRMHLIVENDNYEHLRHGKYRSKLAPKSLIASYLSWAARYNIQLHFCKSETTGWLIGEILHYELREYLLNQ